MAYLAIFFNQGLLLFCGMGYAINRKLDTILRYLSKQYDGSSEHRKLVVEIEGGRFMDGTKRSEQPLMFHKEAKHFYSQADIYKGSEYEKISSIDDIELLLDYLVKNDMIICQGDGKDRKYKISYEGYYLINSGGYVGKEKKETTSKFLQSAATVAIVVGTVAAGAYALKEMIVSEMCRSVLLAICLSSAGTVIVQALYLRYKK